MSDEDEILRNDKIEIGEGSTTLDYLYHAHGWLKVKIDSMAAEIESQRKELIAFRCQKPLVDEVIRLTNNPKATIGMVMGAARRLAEFKP